MQELPFLHSARRLMLIDICMKFCEDSLRGFQVTERTRFLTDRQTDARRKTICFPTLKGGDIIFLKTMLILALGAPLAQLVEYRTLGHNVAGSNLTRDAVKCVLEQDCDLSPLLSTGSTQENIPT